MTTKTVQFIMETPDMAKYINKMCVLQHTFYRLNETTFAEDASVDGGSTQAGPIPLVVFTMPFFLFFFCFAYIYENAFHYEYYSPST